MSEQIKADNGHQEQTGRDNKSQASQGNSIGANKQSFAREAVRVRRILYEVGTDERLRAVFEALFTVAAQGEIQAIKLVLLYSLGKPSDAPSVERLDKMHQEQVDSAEILAALQAFDDAMKRPQPAGKPATAPTASGAGGAQRHSAHQRT